jgi:ligand-binding sensor domain-containing protein
MMTQPKKRPQAMQMRSVAGLICLGLAILLTASCKGLDRKNSSTENAPKPDTTSSQTYSEVKTRDPLFMIEGQLCQHLRRLWQDREGGLWMGTNVYGIIHYDGDSLRYYDQDDGVGSRGIRAIVEDKQGDLWFATSGGLTHYDGKTFRNYDRADGLGNDDIWSMIIDREGMFWLGTGNGVYKFDGEAFTPFSIPSIAVADTTTILSYHRINSILQDRNGTMWFGRDGFGICTWDGQEFRHLTKARGLPDNNITDIFEAKNGDIWIGSMFGGVSRFAGGKFINYTQQGTVEGQEVWSIYQDRAGNIWFPAEGHGVYRFDGESFANIYKAEGLISDAVQCFLEDREGRFWMGGWSGLFRMEGDTVFSVTRQGPWE